MMDLALWLWRFFRGVEPSVVRLDSQLSAQQLEQFELEVQRRVYWGEVTQRDGNIEVTWRIVDPLFSMMSWLCGAFTVLSLGSIAAGLMSLNSNYIQTGFLGVVVVPVVVRLFIVTYRPSVNRALRSCRN